MTAFWFCPECGKLRYDDERKPRVGTTHSVDYEPVLCKRGLHSSKRLIDALKYAPGNMLYLVEEGGIIIYGDDKLVSTQRKYIARFNMSNLLRRFAREQALINIEKIEKYCRTPEEYRTIVHFLKTGSKKVQSAAWSAARAAAESAAWLAAWSAAWSAARLAAESAAESAAWSAARSAARAASESAARAASESAAWSAAWSAARLAAESAAESAAWSAANDMLTSMVRAETGWDI